MPSKQGRKAHQETHMLPPKFLAVILVVASQAVKHISLAGLPPFLSIPHSSIHCAILRRRNSGINVMAGD
jgi:hypothetical protein